MINKITQKKLLIILLFLLFNLASCHQANQSSVDKPTGISTDQNIDSVEATDDDDEEYDSSNVYSQDSDN